MRQHNHSSALKIALRRVVTPMVLGGALAVLPGDAIHGQTGKGTQIHAGVGWGSRHCSECGGRFGGFAANVSVGTRLGPRFLLGGLVGGWIGNVREEDNRGGSTEGTQIAALVAPVARIYPSPDGGTFFLAGIGLGVSTRGIASGETGVGIMAGVGHDFIGAGNFSVTPFVNAIAIPGAAGGTTVIQVGIGLTTR